MIRKLLLAVAGLGSLTLAGCETLPYDDWSGDDAYGKPTCGYDYDPACPYSEPYDAYGPVYGRPPEWDRWDERRREEWRRRRRADAENRHHRRPDGPPGPDGPGRPDGPNPPGRPDRPERPRRPDPNRPDLPELVAPPQPLIEPTGPAPAPAPAQADDDNDNAQRPAPRRRENPRIVPD